MFSKRCTIRYFWVFHTYFQSGHLIASLFLLDSEIYHELSVQLNARKLYISETISSMHYSSGNTTHANGAYGGESGFNTCGLFPGKQSPSARLSDEYAARSNSSLYSDRPSSLSNVRGKIRLSEPVTLFNQSDAMQLRSLRIV